MGVFLWIVRAIIILFIIRLVLRLVFPPRRPAPTRPAAPGGPVERVGGELVRCAQCGTFVPKSRAIAVGAGDDVKYFCSTTCKDAHDEQLRSSNVEVRS